MIYADPTDSYLDKINKLEAENKELQEELEAKQVILNDFKSRCETVTERFNKKSGELERAKEIIKDFLKFGYGAFCYNVANEIIEKAEAFIKGA